MFLRDGSHTAANSDDPNIPLKILLLVHISGLLAVPPMILNNPLPFKLSVAKPMILLFFAEFLEDFPLLESTEASKRFTNFLHWEIVAISAGGLAADNYWAKRIAFFRS